MNKSRLLSTLLYVAVGMSAGFLVSRWMSPQTTSEADKEILYWAAPMDPNYRRDEPGKSPMGMDLIPVYKNTGGMSDGEPALQLNPAVVNNIGVRTAKTMRGNLQRTIDAVGFVEPNDDLTSVLHVRSEGWIEHLLVKTEGERVGKGDTLFQLYSPVITNAKTEFVQAVRIGRAEHIKAASERLRSLGLEQDQIDYLRKNGKVERLVDIRAQQDGVILELNVSEGAYVKPGTTILNLADLNSIWVQVEIFEDQASWVEEGQTAIMRLPFIPGRLWHGSVDYVYPMVDTMSRTVRVRMQFDNHDQALKPGMYTEIAINGTELEDALSIPREALIRAGKSERVILALGEGRFRPAQVVAGMEFGDHVQILSGLQEDEMVVISSQFLIDSEASLDGSLLRMDTGADDTAMDMAPASTEPASRQKPELIVADGVVNSIMTGHNMINITHEPIEALNWPVMTMNFTTTEDVDLSSFEIGERVQFTLMPQEDGSYLINSISTYDVEGEQ